MCRGGRSMGENQAKGGGLPGQGCQACILHEDSSGCKPQVDSLRWQFRRPTQSVHWMHTHAFRSMMVPESCASDDGVSKRCSWFRSHYQAHQPSDRGAFAPLRRLVALQPDCLGCWGNAGMPSVGVRPKVLAVGLKNQRCI